MIRVLHVDDEPDVANLTATYLEREDDRFKVETETSASEGYNRLAEGGFDCVISDYNLPGQNGIEFLEAVREEYPDLPFILYTGKGSEEVASDAISSGVTDYLQKEANTGQYAVLANRVANAVEGSRGERERRRQIEAIEAAREGICILEGGRFTYVNKACAELYGYDPEEMIGERWELLYPDDDIGDVRDEIIPKAKETGYWHGNTTGLRSNGGTFIADHVLAMSDRGELIYSVRDITGHEKREQQLERYEKIVTTAGDSIYTLDSTGQFTMVNDRLVEQSGYDRDELLNSHVSLLLGEADIERGERLIREILIDDERESRKYEVTARTATGEAFPCELRIAPLFDGDEFCGTVGISRNIADREADRHELKRVRDLLQHTERLANVGGWEIDTDTMNVFWTDNLFDLLGVDEDEEPPLEEAIDIYHEDDRSIVENAVEKALGAGERFDVEARFRRPDGEIRWLHIQGTPTVENGDVVTLRGAVQDVTERQTRERVLRDMYDIISDGEHSFDSQIRALLELGRAELDTEYGSLSEITGNKYRFEVVAADDDSIRAGDVVPLEATNCELVASQEETITWGDIARDVPEQTDRAGYTEWGISCYLGAPVYDNDGVYGTFCFYGTDTRADQFSEWEVTLVELMSRWVSYELQRKQVTEQLKRQNERLEEFASIVSHDLRNPLSVMSGWLELAEETGDSEGFTRCFDALERMEALIDDLLTLSKAGAAIDDVESVALGELAERAWSSVPTESATLELAGQATVPADASRLQQLLENLFRNAIEHGGDDVYVTVGPLSDGFYVEDDGSGISEADRDAVFESGYSTGSDGTGFGLAIGADIVEAHDWTISVVDGEAGGARFEITGIDTP